jgi:hypothetical protein
MDQSSISQSNITQTCETERDNYWLKWEPGNCEQERFTGASSRISPRKKHKLKKLTVVTRFNRLDWSNTQGEELSNQYIKKDLDLQVERYRYWHSRDSKEAQNVDEQCQSGDIAQQNEQPTEGETRGTNLFDNFQTQSDLESTIEQQNQCLQQHCSQTIDQYQTGYQLGNSYENQEFGAWEMRSAWGVIGNSRQKFTMEESSYRRYQPKVIATV